MKSLTDEILRSEIQTNSTAGIIFLFGMLFIVLLVIIKLYLHNKKMDNNPKSIKKYVYPTLIGIVCFWLSFFIFKAFTFKERKWLLRVLEKHIIMRLFQIMIKLEYQKLYMKKFTLVKKFMF